MAENRSKQLDRLDRLILRELQANARISNTELAKRINLSATPCAERVRHLQADGYITGYRTLLDPKLLDLELLVFVEISLIRTSPEVFDQFSSAVIELDEILECHLVSGNFDYLLKARVADMSAYRKLLGETILTLPGVNESRTYVVMEEIKETDVLPI